MYHLNHIIYALLNPLAFGLILLAVGFVFGLRRWRRTGLTFVGLSLAWLSFWSMGVFVPNLRTDLEELYPPQRVEEMPQADAIVILGGGVNFNTNELVYAELHEASDRVWHAARLYKAGKAPVILISGKNEDLATKTFLHDLGVPDSAIMIEPDARNTEENAWYTARILKERQTSSTSSKILLVTSAVHMRRAVLMFERALARMPGQKIEIIPAATDYEGLNSRYPFSYHRFFPSVGCLYDRFFSFKEILGYWGYRWFRR